MHFPTPLGGRTLITALTLAISAGGTPQIQAQPFPGSGPIYEDAAVPRVQAADDRLHAAYARWQRARSGQDQKEAKDALYEAAIHADRPDLAEEAVAGGPLKNKQVPLPRRCRDVPLCVVHRFDEITVDPHAEVADAPNESSEWSSDESGGSKWLARRITRDALEVWTPTHGWLFNGAGGLRHEARSPDGACMGREWYGAFLPDGRWVTTDLGKSDCTLTFFSPEGKRLRDLPNAGLPFTGVEGAVPDADYLSHSLLGWARGNREGTAWIVNVGSEQGFATVQVGSEGPPRQLFGVERWQACYPRALGPRGWYIDLWVPDDAGRILLSRGAAGHGPYVGYPGYAVLVPEPTAMPAGNDDGSVRCSVPDGNAIFGFWPGRRDVFIGAIRRADAKTQRAKPHGTGSPPDENATWFFTAEGVFRGWLRGRRLADAADGRAMLLRMEGSHRVVTLRPNLRAADVRRFAWPDGRTAVALSLFDDLRLGLFIRDGKLALASWR